VNSADSTGLGALSILRAIWNGPSTVLHAVIKYGQEQFGTNSANGPCPSFIGGLAPGSSAEQAIAELAKIGIKVPDDYVAWPTRNGNGWNFSPADDVGTEKNLIRAMDSSNNPELYPYGDANVYDAAGNPVNAQGLTPTSRADWHQPFKGVEEPPEAFDFDGE
jgi:hypothetical protein